MLLDILVTPMVWNWLQGLPSKEVLFKRCLLYQFFMFNCKSGGSLPPGEIDWPLIRKCGRERLLQGRQPYGLRILSHPKGRQASRDWVELNPFPTSLWETLLTEARASTLARSHTLELTIILHQY